MPNSKNFVDHHRRPMATAADDHALRRLEDATRDPPRLQLDTLRSILADNSAAAYLRRHLPPHLLSDADAAVDHFRRLVPVTSYDDYADAISRVADGLARPDELSPRPLLCFFLSSGTSSLKPKLVPFFESPGAKAASDLPIQANSAIVRRFPPRPTVNKALWFLYAGDVTRTKGGYEAMTATAWGIRNSLRAPSPVLSACVSPPAVILGSDSQQQLYCHLLCGLRRWDTIDCVRAPYAAGLVRAIRFLEAKWQQLCDDIESGKVCGDVTDTAMREAVHDVLEGPRPDLADRIRGVCRREDWHGVLRDLWPDMRYISCVSTGIMEQYYPAIKYYAGPAVPLLGADYLASECPVGINLDRMSPPEQTSYVLLPTAAYFEFIPFDMEEGWSEGTHTVDISGLEVGKAYEIVVTTYRGLYRYRLGDVVKVVGFHNSSPKLQFVTRAPKEPSEVLTERHLMSAMESFQLMLKEEVNSNAVEFAGFCGDGAGRRHVKSFVEVSEGCRLLEKRFEESSAFLKRCCISLEGCFGGAYRLRRARGDVGALDIAVVSPGSFDRLTEAAMRSGAPANQYKPPKIIRHHHLVDLLESSVVCSSTEAHLWQG